MKRLIRFLTWTVATILPASAAAHAGHSAMDPASPAHYLVGVHGLEVLALVLLLVAAIWKLQTGESRSSNTN